MNGVNLIDSFAEIKEAKSIDRETMMSILEDVFRGLIIKEYGSDENFDFIINVEKGDLEIWRNRAILLDDDIQDDNLEVALEEVRKVDADYEVGEEYSEEIKIEQLGRRNILSMRQTLMGKILDLEKDGIYAKYKDRVGEIIAGEVYQIWKKEILLLDDEDSLMTTE